MRVSGLPREHLQPWGDVGRAGRPITLRYPARDRYAGRIIRMRQTGAFLTRRFGLARRRRTIIMRGIRARQTTTCREFALGVDPDRAGFAEEDKPMRGAIFPAPGRPRRRRFLPSGRSTAAPLAAVVLMAFSTLAGCEEPPRPGALSLCAPGLVTVDELSIPPNVPSSVTVRLVEAVRGTHSFDLDTAPRAESSAGGQVTATLRRTESSADVARLTVTADQAGDIRVHLRVDTTLPGVGDCEAVAAFAAAPVELPGDVTARAVEEALEDKLIPRLKLDLQGARDLTDRVPLVPLQAAVVVPGAAAGSARTKVKVAGFPVDVKVSVEWGDRGGAAALIKYPDPLSMKMSLLPKIVPIGETGGHSAQVKITCKVWLTATLARETVRLDQELEAQVPISTGLQLPQLLALYRAPDFGEKYPDWRRSGGNPGEGMQDGNVPADQNSGVVVYARSSELARPNTSQVDFAPTPHLRMLNESYGLGTRLALIAGPVNTPLGAAGLSELPTRQADLDGLSQELREQIKHLKALAETIKELARTYAAMAGKTGERFARITPEPEVADLGRHDVGALITGKITPGAVVQDERSSPRAAPETSRSTVTWR